MPHAMLGRSKIDASGPLRLTRWRGRRDSRAFSSGLAAVEADPQSISDRPRRASERNSDVARGAKKKGVESGRSGSLWGGDRGFESSSLQRGVRNEPVPQRPQNYGAKRFTSDKQNWGYQLRFGLFEISDVDLTRLTSM